MARFGCFSSDRRIESIYQFPDVVDEFRRFMDPEIHAQP
jgi:hypothetical protein